MSALTTILVRYQLEPGCSEDNKQLIAAVFEQLAREHPDGLSYASFELEDGLSFVHLAHFAGDNPLATLATFRQFTAQLGDRCTEPPVATALTVVGAYRMFAGAP